MAKAPGLFDVEERMQRLSEIGDQLEAFAAVVDFEMFRADLLAALGYSDGAKGGRPPFDPVMMFKVLVVQAQNNLSDDRAKFLINDRLSFMRFLGLGLGDRVPDAKTIWAFRERLTRAGAIGALFARFDRAVRNAGHIPMPGQIVEASLVSAARQRNSEAEKLAIKSGRVPDGWADKPKTPRHLEQGMGHVSLPASIQLRGLSRTNSQSRCSASLPSFWSMPGTSTGVERCWRSTPTARSRIADCSFPVPGAIRSAASCVTQRGAGCHSLAVKFRWTSQRCLSPAPLIVREPLCLTEPREKFEKDRRFLERPGKA